MVVALLCQTAYADPAPGKTSKDAAWLLVGGSLAFVTTGAVLAYSADSSEKDLEDLYLTVDGGPATFDAKTAARYDRSEMRGTIRAPVVGVVRGRRRHGDRRRVLLLARAR